MVISAVHATIANAFGPVVVRETNDDTTDVSDGAFHSFITCDDVGTTSGVLTGTHSISIPILRSGEDVICTITNVPVAPAECSL